MNDAPRIDDCRRFKELWKELVARAVVALVGGLAASVFFGLSANARIEAGFVGSLVIAAPSLMVRRGWSVVAVPAATIITSTAIIRWGDSLLFPDAPDSWVVWSTLYFATVWAAVGTVEGVLDGSIASIYSGLLAGPLLGVASHNTGLLLSGTEHGFHDTSFVCCAVVKHLGIGLSLALGRWIRDLPKRKAQQFEGDGGDAAAS